AEFGFRFLCDGCGLDDPLKPLKDDWETLPYYRMDLHYINGLPPANLTNQLLLQGDEITRYAFVIKTNSVTTGYMLREVHHPVGQRFYVDHWAFKASYAPPSETVPEVLVLRNSTQYATTADFFVGLKTEGIVQYTKATYDEGVGGDYTP